MPRAYTSAAIPVPFRIFGLEMKPFSPGHYVLLDSLDNAFVSEETRDLNITDLLLGILICSRSFADGKKLVGDANRLNAEFEKIGEMAGRFAGNRRSSIDDVVAERARLFLDYIENATREPAYFVLQKGGESAGIHWFAAMKLCLTGELGYSQTEFWDAPLSQCLSDRLGYMESRGAIKLVTDAEIAQGKANESVVIGLETYGQ